MLNVLIAADAPDTGWNVTTSVAAAAAGISLVTLLVTTYFTSRRETVKWAREALAEAFYDFVNASYAAGQAFHEHQKLLWADPDPSSLDASAVELESQTLALRHAQTKIGLLARARTVELANQVRFRYRDGIEGSASSITTDEHRRRRAVIADARERFIDSAKRDMALPR